MGNSPLHASTVGLVRNLRTGNLSPQFHLVYDDYFETVHSDEANMPEVWPELVECQQFRSEVEEDKVPKLDKQW